MEAHRMVSKPSPGRQLNCSIQETHYPQICMWCVSLHSVDRIGTTLLCDFSGNVIDSNQMDRRVPGNGRDKYKKGTIRQKGEMRWRPQGQSEEGPVWEFKGKEADIFNGHARKMPFALQKENNMHLFCICDSDEGRGRSGGAKCRGWWHKLVLV